MRLLERELELKAIAGALAQAAAGSGCAVLIEGPAGVGKSALMRAAGEIAGDLGMDALRATGRGIESGFAFGVAMQLFSPVLEPLSDSERGELLAGAAEFALPLLVPGSGTGFAGDRHTALHGLHWLCANLAARRPLALLVDDAHWADAPSLALLPYLAPRLAELAVCLVVSVRSGETADGDALAGALEGEGVRALRPGALSEPAVGKLVAARLNAPASPDLVRECAETTGGNPLFVRELLRHLAERGAAAPREAATAAPESVTRIVLERIRKLAGDAPGVVEALAILGDGAGLQLIAQLAGIGSERVEAELDRLIAAGLLEPGLPPRFEHPIVRQAVYGSIAPGARARGHLAAARALAADPDRSEAAAAHLLATEGIAEPAGPLAVAALRSAARAAKDRGASEQGARLLTRALDEPLDDSERQEVLLELGTEELGLGRESSMVSLKEAERLAGDPSGHAGAALALSVAQSQMGALAEAVATCERGLDAVGEADRELRLGLLTQQATVRWLSGAMSDEDRGRLHAMEREVASGETPAERRLLSLLAANAAQTGSRPARETARLAASALRGGRLLADLGAEHPSYMLAVAAQTMSGDLAASIEEWSHSVEDSRRRGSMYGYANSLFSRAYASCLAGDLSAAEADAVEGFELLSDSGLFTAPFPLATAALVAAERGGLAPSLEQALDRVVARSEAPGPGAVTYAVLSAGWLAFSRGEVERALELFEQTGRIAERIGMTGPAALPWRSGAARALQALGRAEEAVALVEEELTRARAFEAPGPVGIALRHRALIGGPKEGVEPARESVDALERSEATLEHAKALIGLGMALRRAGATRDAREPLLEGMHLANRCGSTRAVDRAVEELRSVGARPRRPALRGADSLSPRERQTARLAAHGLGNREIAEAMFVTRRTVEMHLSSAYRKLEISSREQLGAALEREVPRAA